MKIALPFPDKILWPNGRGHHMAKHRALQKHKQWAKHATLAVMPHYAHDGTPIRFRVTFTPLTAHAIDADNAIASLKAYFDGIALALKVDDSCFAVPEIVFTKPKRPGLVEVELACASVPDRAKE